MVARIPLDNVNARPHRTEIAKLARQWPALEPGTEQYLSQTIAPLLRLVWTGSLPELQFRITCERIALAWLSGDRAEVDASAARAREAVG